MSNLILTAVNILAGLIVFIHCVCRLSVRRWTWRQPELWAHALMVGGAIGVFFSSLIRESPLIDYTQPVPAELVFNVGAAVYFLAQTWRLRKMKRGGHCV